MFCTCLFTAYSTSYSNFGKLLDPCNQYEYLVCSNNRLKLAELIVCIGAQVVICGMGGELCLFVRGRW